MKLNKWLYGAAALAMLAACSDKDIAPGSDNPNNSVSDGTITGYIAVDINLPQESSTRTEMNDQFDDGLASEWVVNNAMLVLFKGEEEQSATFYKAIDLVKPFFENKPGDNNITSSYIAAVPVEKISDGKHYFGLVILNRDKKTKVAPGTDGTSDNVAVGGLDMVKGTTKFSDILNLTLTGENFTENGFFMTNAPLSNKLAKNITATDHAGYDKTQTDLTKRDGYIHYLTDLGTATYDTPAMAKEHCSGCIFVERAVAKVTCALGNNPFQFSIVDESGNVIETKDLATKFDVSAKVSYALTNTNQESYFVRNVEEKKLGGHFSWNLINLSKYRMIGTKQFDNLLSPYHTDSVPSYRTYWCYDPNYENPMTDAQKHVFDPTKKDEDGNLIDTYKPISEPLYCNENTFAVKHQNNGNTTMVIFKIDLSITPKDGSKASVLYTKDGDQSKIYLTKETAAADEIYRLLTDSDVTKAWQTALKISNPDVTKTFEDIQNFFKISYGEDDGMLMIKDLSLYTSTEKTGSPFNEAGQSAFRDLIGYQDGTTKVNQRDENGNIVKGEDGKTIQVDNQTLFNLLDNVNKWSDITEYTGGTSYYMRPIKHFGDFYTPWPTKAGDVITGVITEDVYNGGSTDWDNDTHAAPYLGRYGMVRNNWYEISISQITGLGSNTLPEIKKTLSDDNLEEKKYIAIEIHTLAWAKRIQSVIL